MRIVRQRRPPEKGPPTAIYGGSFTDQPEVDPPLVDNPPVPYMAEISHILQLADFQ